MKIFSRIFYIFSFLIFANEYKYEQKRSIIKTSGLTVKDSSNIFSFHLQNLTLVSKCKKLGGWGVNAGKIYGNVCLRTLDYILKEAGRYNADLFRINYQVSPVAL